MQFISTRAHGVIDYLMGILLIAAPWLLGFSDAGAAAWVPIVLGIALLGASLMTDYELGAVKMIPMPVHLGLDALVGLVLIVSPWLFGFADRVWVPHVVLGLLEIGAAAFTQRRPSYEAPAGHHTTGMPR